MTQDAESAAPRRGLVHWLFALCGVFVCAHTAWYALGVRFDRAGLDGIMQFLDAALLRTRLLESIWYLHIQPPLFNLLVGLGLKLDASGAWQFHAVFLALGLLLYLSAFTLQWRLGVRPWIAATLCTLFLCSPAFVLFEHFLLYTFPCAALLAFAAVLLFEVCDTGNRRAIGGFFAALFLLCGMRSLFHPVYFLLVWAGLAAALGQYRRRILLFGLLPALLLFGFSLKNFVLFGEFNTCSFTEKNLWIMTVGNLGDERARLLEAGRLSPLSAINRWASLDAYPPEYRNVPERFAGIPAITETHKSNGEVNYNHFGNIALCREYGKDARYVLWHYPRAYLNAVAVAAYRFLKPSSEVPVSGENKARLQGLLAFYNRVIFLECPFDFSSYSRVIQKAGNPPWLTLCLGVPLVLLYGVWRLGRPGLNKTRRIVLVFLCFNILMVAVLGCALDFHETARYRFLTDAFSLALLGMALTSFARRLAPVSD